MKGSVNKVKQTVYTKPTLQKVELAANDILLASGEAPGEYEVRGSLNTFDITSEQYQWKNWSDFFYN